MSKFNINTKVRWNSEAGHVSGTIRKIHTKPFYLTGKDGTKYLRHASKDNPVYEIKSSKTDHIAYHYGDSLHKYAKGGVTVTYYDFDGNPIKDINEWGKSTNTPTINPNIIEPLYNSSPVPTPVYTPNKSWFINPDGSIALDYNKLANDRTAYGHSTYDNYTNRLTAYDGIYGYNHAVDGDYYADGGIHIKSANRGLFTQWAKDNGFSSVQSAASHVLANKDNYSTHVVQMANFAKNTTKFHHKKYDGGGPSNIYGDTNGDGVLDEDEKYRLSIANSQAPNINTSINTNFSLRPNNHQPFTTDPFTPKPFPKAYQEALSQGLYNNPDSLATPPEKMDYLDLNRPLMQYKSDVTPKDLTANISPAKIDSTPIRLNTGFGYGASSASAIGSVAKQAFETADNIRRGIIGLNQDLAKGSLALTSALSTNLNQPEQKKRSIRQAIDDGSYNQDFGRLYYADGGNVTNYNINTPNISQIATRPQGANAEVEQGEVIKLPDGSTVPIEGNNAFKHYENNNVGSMGTPVNIPDNSFIYSDRKIKGESTKLNKQVASDILNKKVKKSMSMGDIAKKLDNTKYDKILNDVSATPIQKRTAAINKEMNTVKLKQLADYQESFKLLQNPQNKFADGGDYRDDPSYQMRLKQILAERKAQGDENQGVVIDLQPNQVADNSSSDGTENSNTSSVYEGSFTKAYSKAKKDLGQGAVFTWANNGKDYLIKDAPKGNSKVDNNPDATQTNDSKITKDDYLRYMRYLNPQFIDFSQYHTPFISSDSPINPGFYEQQSHPGIPRIRKEYRSISPDKNQELSTNMVQANPDYDEELREYNNMNPVLKVFAMPPSRLPKPIEFAVNPVVMSSITGVGSPLSNISSFEELGTGITNFTKTASKDAVKEMVRRNIQEDGELAGRKILNMKETTPELKAIKKDLLDKYYELVDEGTKKIPGLKEHYQASSKPLNNVRELDKVLPKPTARVGRSFPNPNITKPKSFVRKFFSEPKPDPTKPWWNIFKDGGNKFPNGGYLTNADIPEGYSPDIAQGYYDANGNYINAQPTDANYRNPRYMFLKPNGTQIGNAQPIVANTSLSDDSFGLTTGIPVNVSGNNGYKFMPTTDTNTPINSELVNPYQEQSVKNSNRRSLTDLASDINWKNVGKGIQNGVNNAVGWAGNVLDSAMGALPGLVGVLSDVPVNGNPIDLQYLPNARQNNSVTRRVQDQIATKFNERAKFMNPALQQAYDAQLVANTAPILEEAAATDYQDYLRQQDAINNANIQTSNKEDMINNGDQARVNELLMRKRDSNIRDIQASLQNAYTQRMGAKKERNTLALLNQLSPNYQYNINQPGQGEQFVYDEDGNPYIKTQDASGKIFYEPAVTGVKKEDPVVKKKKSIKK